VDNILVRDLLVIIFRLMTIFLCVISGEYFGERFVGNYFQIDDNISVSDLWIIFW